MSTARAAWIAIVCALAGCQVDETNGSGRAALTDLNPQALNTQGVAPDPPCECLVFGAEWSWTTQQCECPAPYVLDAPQLACDCPEDPVCPDVLCDTAQGETRRVESGTNCGCPFCECTSPDLGCTPPPPEISPLCRECVARHTRWGNPNAYECCLAWGDCP